MRLESRIVHAGIGSDEKTGAISTPIYQSATFRHPALGRSTGYDYSRTQNPTRQVAEEAVAALEGGVAGFAFASGMAAITAVLMMYPCSSHLVVVEDCYGGTYHVIDKVFSKFGFDATYVDGTDLEAVRQAMKPNTVAIIMESPTNPLMKIVDIRGIAAIAHQYKAQAIIDNTFLTPYLQRPLELGADIVVHSGTKYLAGHNDILCGLVVCRETAIAEQVKFIQNSTGGILSPNDSWLLLRGMKTLALRMEQHSRNARQVAEWLVKHPSVIQVYYPGLDHHEGKKLHESQSAGYGGMLSFVVDRPELVPQVLRKVRLLQFAESLGGVESLITYPAAQTHADVPVDIRNRLGISDRLLYQ